MSLPFALTEISVNISDICESMPGKTHSSQMRNLVISKFLEKMPEMKISEQLQMSRNTVHSIISVYKKDGRIERKLPPGRPSKSTEKSQKTLRRLSTICPKLTSKQLKRDWADGHKYSDSSIRRILRKYGLFGRRGSRKPTLTKLQIAARMKFCKSLKNNTIADWQKVIFSDECGVQLKNGRVHFVRRPKGAKFRDNRKYLCQREPAKQKSIMVFGAIWHNGLRTLERIDGTMNGPKYIDVLRQKVLPLMQDDQILQQDNATCHTSSEVKAFMELEGIALLPNWPARSPDLNIIENLWEVLKQNVGEHQIRNLEELWQVIETEYFKISDDYISTLFNSLPNRVKEVIKNHGYPTKY